MAAIDGHAKNYSLFLEASSAYRMAPLYDVISAYPLMTQGSIPAEKAKMAMSVKGRNRHYHWARIQPRHFLSTAQQVGFSAEKAKTLMDEMAEKTETVIGHIHSMLPSDFPDHISQPILEGIREQAKVLN